MIKEEILQQAAENLPEDYVNAVIGLDLTNKIEAIGVKHDLDDKEVDILDREVVYLLLHIIDSPEFTERLGTALQTSNETLLSLVKSITNDILFVLEESLDSSNTERVAEMPVPPPPPVPGSGYGGTSDPYREPTESN